MQTGQNSIAPENSLPQLGQVRRDFVFINLTLLPLRLRLRKALEPEPEQALHYYGWSEIG
jgi:hypothetical protein